MFGTDNMKKADQRDRLIVQCFRNTLKKVHSFSPSPLRGEGWGGGGVFWADYR